MHFNEYITVRFISSCASGQDHRHPHPDHLESFVFISTRCFPEQFYSPLMLQSIINLNFDSWKWTFSPEPKYPLVKTCTHNVENDAWTEKNHDANILLNCNLQMKLDDLCAVRFGDIGPAVDVWKNAWKLKCINICWYCWYPLYQIIWTFF